MDFLDRPGSAVAFGVHHDDVLALSDRSDYHAGRKLDRSRNLQNYVDPPSIAQQHWIVGDRTLTLGDAVIQLVRRAHIRDIVLAAFGISHPGAIETTVRDRREFHALRVVKHLPRDPGSHETGADHSDSDRGAGAMQ